MLHDDYVIELRIKLKKRYSNWSDAEIEEFLDRFIRFSKFIINLSYQNNINKQKYDSKK
jgi:hypothetical protein